MTTWRASGAHFAASRPELDDLSRTALRPAAPAERAPWYLVNAQSDASEPADAPDDYDTTTIEGLIWGALCAVPEEGADVAELMRMTGLGRSTVYRYLAQLAEQGRAVQVGWGRWRTVCPGRR